VSEISNVRSGRRRRSQGATHRPVVVVLGDKGARHRPGFTCTADITTATRTQVTAAPIPAVAVRELVYDAHGQIVKAPPKDRRSRTPEPTAAAAELLAGQTRKETEGVFVLRDGKPSSSRQNGRAGDKYLSPVRTIR
jgi:hypothetical protein